MEDGEEDSRERLFRDLPNVRWGFQGEFSSDSWICG